MSTFVFLSEVWISMLGGQDIWGEASHCLLHNFLPRVCHRCCSLFLSLEVPSHWGMPRMPGVRYISEQVMLGEVLLQLGFIPGFWKCIKVVLLNMSLWLWDVCHWSRNSGSLMMVFIITSRWRFYVISSKFSNMLTQPVRVLIPKGFHPKQNATLMSIWELSSVTSVSHTGSDAVLVFSWNSSDIYIAVIGWLSESILSRRKWAHVKARTVLLFNVWGKSLTEWNLMGVTTSSILSPRTPQLRNFFVFALLFVFWVLLSNFPSRLCDCPVGYAIAFVFVILSFYLEWMPDVSVCCCIKTVRMTFFSIIWLSASLLRFVPLLFPSDLFLITNIEAPKLSSVVNCQETSLCTSTSAPKAPKSGHIKAWNCIPKK